MGHVPLSVAELRRLLWHLAWQPPLSPRHLLHWSAWRRRHQAIAQFYHFKRRAVAMRWRELLMGTALEGTPADTAPDIADRLYVKMIFAMPLLWLATSASSASSGRQGS